jgi:hypothetical protein
MEKSLLVRLKYWDEVFPCDIDKPEGQLYEDAYYALLIATEVIRGFCDIAPWPHGVKFSAKDFSKSIGEDL